ncbi:MAG: iron complex outermembrane receptor protein, partial [Cognaticolwellia sp.]
VALHYPSEAIEEGLEAKVSVLVRVGTGGQVLGIDFESGPQVFKSSALRAASRLEFVPASKNGRPIEATTRVWFYFTPPVSSDMPGPSEAAIVVHAASADRESIQAQTTLHQEDLDALSGMGLTETLEGVPGVYAAPTTMDSAKPIIRGHQERRLLVLYDGVRHEGQNWGPDHPTEIDPFSAGSIAVIRGPAGSRYGADAIGGVILVRPPPLSRVPGVHGRALAAFESNGMRPYGALRLDAVSEAHPEWSFRIEGNGGAGASLRAPEYVLGNTASQSWNLGGAVGYHVGRTSLEVAWHHNDLKSGAFYGVSSATPAEFLEQLELGPANAASWQADYGIDRAYQHAAHDIGILKGARSASWGKIEARYAFQRNHRREYSQVRSTVGGPQYRFVLRTHSLDIHLAPEERELGVGSLQGGVGFQASFQENVYRGYSLLPNYRSFGGGVYWVERLTLRHLDIEAGARVDGLHRSTYLSQSDFEKHERRETLSEAVCEMGESGARCPASFRAGSVSLGAQLHAIPQTLDIKGELSSTGRFPDVDELFLIGSAPSLPVFALGTPDLNTERAWTGTLTTTLMLGWMRIEASAFAQRIQDYIYFSPDLNLSGDPRYEVTIQGTWPRYTYEAVNANFYGVDGGMTLLSGHVVSMDLQGAIVRGVDADSGLGLNGIPADNLTLTLLGSLPPLGPCSNPELELGTQLVAEQTRVDPSTDFAPAPDSYALLNAGASAQLGPARVSVQGRNLLNAAYRDYTSLLRYYADQPGRSVHVRVGVDF